MDIALVQNAKHKINDHDSDEEKNPEVGHRALKGSGKAAKARAEGSWDQAIRGLPDVVDGFAK